MKGIFIAYLASLSVLLLLSGFFSAAETAFTGLSAARIKSYAKTSGRARRVLKLNEKYGEVLTALLIGNNVVNIAATTVATALFFSAFGERGVTLCTLVMTSVVLVFGEVIPKTVARETPEKFAMFSAGAVEFFCFVFKPLCALFSLIQRLIRRAFAKRRNMPQVTGEEFKIILADAEKEGVIGESQKRIMLGALNCGSLTAKEVMRPAKVEEFIGFSSSADEAERAFEGTNAERLFALSESKTRVLGVLERADFYEAHLSPDEGVRRLIKPVLRCKKSDALPQIIRSMQLSHCRTAIVLDGSRPLGTLTYFDLLNLLIDN